MRLKSGILVGAILKTAQAEGLFATLLRKGDEDAGAIYVVVRARSGRLRCFGPSEQSLYAADQTERLFRELDVADDAALSAFMEREGRFDPDFWIVEIEDDSLGAPVPLAPSRGSADDIFG